MAYNIIYPHLRGGLGNQMFQIAACMGYAERHPGYVPTINPHFIAHPVNHHARLLYFNITILNQIFSDGGDAVIVVEDEKDRFKFIPLETRIVTHVYQNKKSEPTKDLKPLSQWPRCDIALFGYFQSPAYFPSREKLLNVFNLHEDYHRVLFDKYSKIINNPNTLSIHLRRGDYLNFTTALDQARYDAFLKESLTQAKKLVPEVVVVVFSDDKEYARKVFPDAIISGELDFMDFWLMANCRHHIIPASTFSWFAAYLSPHVGGHNWIIHPWLECAKDSKEFENMPHLTNLHIIDVTDAKPPNVVMSGNIQEVITAVSQANIQDRAE